MHASAYLSLTKISEVTFTQNIKNMLFQVEQHETKRW